MLHKTKKLKLHEYKINIYKKQSYEKNDTVFVHFFASQMSQ